MRSFLILTFIILTIISCKKSQSDEVLFIQADEIDSKLYFQTEANMANDPNNVLMEMFRSKKKADLADPSKPRPFTDVDVSTLESISSEIAWQSLDSIFRWDWSSMDNKGLISLSSYVKSRQIFDNLDFKVYELVVAPGATLPMHSEPTPSVYHILGGSGEISAGASLSNVYTGSSIFFDIHERKRVVNTSKDTPLKILWMRWAPEGDESYLQSGYYLTGCNTHLQTEEAVLPAGFDFWDHANDLNTDIKEIQGLNDENISKQTQSQIDQWRIDSQDKRYQGAKSFYHEQNVEWVDVVNLDPKSFFFADDIQKLGPTLNLMKQIAKIKSVFRAKRSDEGYDLNYSYLAWGPLSKYITHSHAICEFYYVLEGDVEYIIDENTFHAKPGNFYFHPPYYDHEMRGLKKDTPFLSISGTWVPLGDRSLFEKPFYLLEDISDYKGPGIPSYFDFHHFEMKDNY